MPSMGTLLADHPVKVEFATTNNGTARGGVTMYFLKSGRVVDIQGFTGAVPLFDMTLPRSATRLVLEANPSPLGGTVTLRVVQLQSPLTVDETVQEDMRFVFDIV
jgi:hypothetical protein